MTDWKRRIILSAAGPFDTAIGGGQVYVQSVAGELLARGHAVTVIAPAPWMGDDAGNRASGAAYCIRRRDWRGAQVVDLALDPQGGGLGEDWEKANAPLLEGLREVLRHVRPDLIHLNGLKPALATVAREMGIPHVITAHHPGVVCPAGVLLTNKDRICDRPMSPRACVPCYCGQVRRGRAAGRVLGALPALVYRPLGRAISKLKEPGYLARAMMYPWMVERAIDDKRVALSRGQRWIAPSRAIAAALERNGVEPARISVIPHGITPLPRLPLEGLGQRPVRFGFVGRVDRAKGLHVLVEAFLGLPPQARCELHIIGAAQNPHDQAYFDACLAPARGRADVVLHGKVPHDELGKHLAQVDMVVLPAISAEVFGLVVLEAFSAGRPVIVTDCGGPAELVRHGVDGVVVPPNDVPALRAAMAELATDPCRIIELSQHIQAVRTLQQHADDLEGVYQSVTRERLPVGERSA